MPVMPGYANAETPHAKTVHLPSQGWRYGCSSARTGDDKPRGGTTKYIAHTCKHQLGAIMSEKMTTPMPCPFCGNEARKISTSLDERFGYALEVSYGCPVCGFRLSARGDSSKGGYADNRGVEEAALRKWNARIDDASREAAIQAAVEAEREACAKVCDTISSSDFLPHQCAAAIRTRGESDAP